MHTWLARGQAPGVGGVATACKLLAHTHTDAGTHTEATLPSTAQHRYCMAVHLGEARGLAWVLCGPTPGFVCISCSSAGTATPR